MNCVELHQSLSEIEDGSSTEQRAHLKGCQECSALVAELHLIICGAAELQGAHEPSPRVWNAIEIALRQEGIIRPQRSSRSLLPSFGSPWGWARWVVPAAAVFLLTVGLYIRQHTPSRQTADESAINPAVKTGAVSDAGVGGLNDDTGSPGPIHR
jgi:anti-sigma factor RsiW